MFPTPEQLESACEWVRRFGHTETGFAALVLHAELYRLRRILAEFGEADAAVERPLSDRNDAATKRAMEAYEAIKAEAYRLRTM